LNISYLIIYPAAEEGSQVNKTEPHYYYHYQAFNSHQAFGDNKTLFEVRRISFFDKGAFSRHD